MSLQSSIFTSRRLQIQNNRNFLNLPLKNWHVLHTCCLLCCWGQPNDDLPVPVSIIFPHFGEHHNQGAPIITEIKKLKWWRFWRIFIKSNTRKNSTDTGLTIDLIKILRKNSFKTETVITVHFRRHRLLKRNSRLNTKEWLLCLQLSHPDQFTPSELVNYTDVLICCRVQHNYDLPMQPSIINLPLL